MLHFHRFNHSLKKYVYIYIYLPQVIMIHNVNKSIYIYSHKNQTHCMRTHCLPVSSCLLLHHFGLQLCWCSPLEHISGHFWQPMLQRAHAEALGRQRDAKQARVASRVSGVSNYGSGQVTKTWTF